MSQQLRDISKDLSKLGDGIEAQQWKHEVEVRKLQNHATYANNIIQKLVDIVCHTCPLTRYWRKNEN